MLAILEKACDLRLAALYSPVPPDPDSSPTWGNE
jgi:hypothetical protein